MGFAYISMATVMTVTMHFWSHDYAHKLCSVKYSIWSIQFYHFTIKLAHTVFYCRSVFVVMRCTSVGTFSLSFCLSSLIIIIVTITLTDVLSNGQIHTFACCFLLKSFEFTFPPLQTETLNIKSELKSIQLGLTKFVVFIAAKESSGKKLVLMV